MFTIKYLKLVNFKRMPLRDIEVFEHEFKSKLLMVTGSNGSGKSSLVNELTPLPSDKTNFNKDGYKEIHIEKENKLYKLISDFRNGTSFSFIIDNEEQNLSNNITTQKDLVFFHFNITPIIHELLIGSEVFTDMSVLARKKLFSTITHLNIDKVLENYNKLKEELKNNEIILKTQTSLCQAEEQKLLDKNRLDTLKENESRIKEFIEYLLNLRTHLFQYKANDDLETIYNNTKSLVTELEEIINTNYYKFVCFPYKELKRYKENYTTSLSVTNYQLNELYGNLENKLQEFKVLSTTKETNLKSLEIKHTELKEIIQKLINSLKYIKFPVNNIEQIKLAIYKLEVSLPDIIRSIPTNIDRKFSREKYDTLLNTKQDLLNKLTEVGTKEIALMKELESLKNHNDLVSCPNCTHTWSLKDVPSLIEKNKNQLSSLLEEKIKLQKAIEVNNKNIEETIEYFTLYKQYATIRNSTHNELKTFWDEIDSRELIFNNPSSISQELSLLVLDSVNIETIIQYEKELESISKNIEILSVLKDTNFSKLEKEINELNIVISDSQDYKDSVTSNLEKLEEITTLYTYLEQLKTALDGSINGLFRCNVSHTVTDILNSIESDLSKYKISLIEIEKELHQYNTVQYTLDKYRKTIEDTESNIKVLNIILNELSPKNGLIAKSVSSFLNIIITNINNTISSIWDYKMILKAIDVESEALNYKFKVEVEGKLDISDISICSKGMKEIINLSFRMILYKLLGLEGSPFYADELGSNLDVHHTNNMIQLIQKLSISEKFSQIFIITHKENFNFLPNLETISLDS